MDELAGLIKLIPEGASVSAVMLVLHFGIKHIQKLHDNHTNDKAAQQTAHKDELKLVLDSHKEERERFKDILEDANETNKALMASHKDMMEKHIQTSTEMVTAVRGLETAVQKLQEKVK